SLTTGGAFTAEPHPPFAPQGTLMQAIQLPQATDTNILKATMRVAQVSRPGGPLELVERPIPDPGPGSVRIKVQACGVCHSDVFTKEGQWPGITFPRVPGHEVVGVIDAVGKDVPGRWQAGQRVGVGWHAWHCLSCDNCRRGDFFACQTGA